MTETEVAEALKLGPVGASRHLHELALDPVDIHGRSALVFATEHVAAVLAQWLVVDLHVSPVQPGAITAERAASPCAAIRLAYGLHAPRFDDLVAGGGAFINADASIRAGVAGYGVAIVRDGKVVHEESGPVPTALSSTIDEAELYAVYRGCLHAAPPVRWTILNDNIQVFIGLESLVATGQLHRVFRRSDADVRETFDKVLTMAREWDLCFTQCGGASPADRAARRQTRPQMPKTPPARPNTDRREVRRRQRDPDDLVEPVDACTDRPTDESPVDVVPVRKRINGGTAAPRFLKD